MHDAVFPTSTKQTETISLETLAAICRAVDIPVVAIGGITAANAGERSCRAERRKLMDCDALDGPRLLNFAQDPYIEAARVSRCLWHWPVELTCSGDAQTQYASAGPRVEGCWLTKSWLAAGQAIEAGCAGVAVVSALFDSLDIKASAQDILSVSESAHFFCLACVHLSPFNVLFWKGSVRQTASTLNSSRRQAGVLCCQVVVVLPVLEPCDWGCCMPSTPLLTAQHPTT